MSAPTISELETGKSAGSTKLAAIASALGVNALWLETGKGTSDLSHQEPFEARKYSKETEEIIKLVESTDEIGRGKCLYQVKEIVEMREQIKKSAQRLIKSRKNSSGND